MLIKTTNNNPRTATTPQMYSVPDTMPLPKHSLGLGIDRLQLVIAMIWAAIGIMNLILGFSGMHFNFFIAAVDALIAALWLQISGTISHVRTMHYTRQLKKHPGVIDLSPESEARELLRKGRDHLPSEIANVSTFSYSLGGDEQAYERTARSILTEPAARGALEILMDPDNTMLLPTARQDLEAELYRAIQGVEQSSEIARTNAINQRAFGVTGLDPWRDQGSVER